LEREPGPQRLGFLDLGVAEAPRRDLLERELPTEFLETPRLDVDNS